MCKKSVNWRNLQIWFHFTELAEVTSENMLREFPLVIATVAKVSRKRGLWLNVRVNEKEKSNVENFHSTLLFLLDNSYVIIYSIEYKIYIQEGIIWRTFTCLAEHQRL